MKKNTLKVLGIAPYEGMKAMMLKACAEREDIDLTVYVGDLNKGVEIVQQNFHYNYDVIISRGGTAEMLTHVASIPVIEISLSVYDILRAIKLAENYSNRYAIVGFASITNSAHLLCDLLQYKIDIFTVHDVSEVQSTLEKLKQTGYHMVLCDMVTTTKAKEFGLNAILITSGLESINSAFDQAFKLCQNYTNIKEHNAFLYNLVKEKNAYTLVFDENHRLFFSTLDEDTNPFSTTLFQKEIKETLSTGDRKYLRTIGDTLYTIRSKKIILHQKPYIAFFFTPMYSSIPQDNYGIKHSTQEDVMDSFFNSFYSILHSSESLSTTLKQFNESSLPIMIMGESGTGKDHTVAALYSQSSLCKHPLITIDCTLMNDKNWTFLTNHHKSPLNDNNNTLHIKNLHALSLHRAEEFFTMIMDTNLHKRNRLIFSCVHSPSEPLSPTTLDYINQLSCLTICTHPLRESASEIPTLAALYLSTLNVTLAKQIIGFEPEALLVMQAYHWPYNYTQLKRILNELAVITTTPYISLGNVHTILEKEKSTTHLESLSQSADKFPFYLDSTLETLNQMIIQTVLKKNNGNQSATAKSLGISRTTLWRYLKCDTPHALDT